MKKRYENKKLNKKDHKKMKDAAGGVKKGLALFSVGTIIFAGVKKYGKEIPKLAKNIIFRG
ncbi:MAG: 50S ribosomal protein L17 [Ruminococcaceae bacterium]|nr:50S ribosomal protein L17 [Oscillospiraceae bacterium]